MSNHTPAAHLGRAPHQHQPQHASRKSTGPDIALPVRGPEPGKRAAKQSTINWTADCHSTKTAETRYKQPMAKMGLGAVDRECCIGRGGMRPVWRESHRQTRHLIAVTALDAEAAIRPGYTETFHLSLASIARPPGPTLARRYAIEAVELGEFHGSLDVVSHGHLVLRVLADREGDLLASEAHISQSLQLAQRTGKPRAIAIAWSSLGEPASRQGALAEKRYRTSLAWAEAGGRPIPALSAGQTSTSGRP
jgi:hypothetical protein